MYRQWYSPASCRSRVVAFSKVFNKVKYFAFLTVTGRIPFNFLPVRTASPREAKSLDLAPIHGTLSSKLPHCELPLFLL